MIPLNARNYACTAQHSCVRYLGNALDKRDWRWHLTSAFSQRLRKYTFTAVHTKTHKPRFQICPLWRAFSNLCVYGERFHRLRVDGRPKRIKKFAFTSVCIYNRLRVDGASFRFNIQECSRSLWLSLPFCDIFCTAFSHAKPPRNIHAAREGTLSRF